MDTMTKLRALRVLHDAAKDVALAKLESHQNPYDEDKAMKECREKMYRLIEETPTNDPLTAPIIVNTVTNAGGLHHGKEEIPF